MHVLLLTQWYDSLANDEVNFVYQLSRGLSLAGHAAEILCGSDGADTRLGEHAIITRFRARRAAADITLRMTERAAERALERALQKRARLGSPDAIMSQSASFVNIALHTMPHVPVIYIPTMDMKQYGRVHQDSAKLLRTLPEAMRHDARVREAEAQAYAVQHCAACVVTCQTLKRQLISSYGVKSERVFVRAPGASFASAPDGGGARERAHHRWLYVGSLTRDQNLAALLDAMAELPGDAPQLTIVGNGPELGALLEQCRRLALTGRVQFEGTRQDMKPCYMNADLLVIPACYETRGRAVLDAFACGVPAAGFASIPNLTSTAMEEWIEPDKTGYVCHEYSVSGLARTLLQAAHTTLETLDGMREACRQRAPKPNAWTEFASECARLAARKLKEQNE